MKLYWNFPKEIIIPNNLPLKKCFHTGIFPTLQSVQTRAKTNLELKGGAGQGYSFVGPSRGWGRGGSLLASFNWSFGLYVFKNKPCLSAFMYTILFIRYFDMSEKQTPRLHRNMEFTDLLFQRSRFHTDDRHNYWPLNYANKYNTTSHNFHSKV